MLLGIFSACMPDLDVIGFSYGIHYESFWGHRGFMHSILFALLWSVLLSMLFIRQGRKKWLIALIVLFLCTVSHAFFDGMTSGGRGVAYFSPWDNGRYFLPFRPIIVSPLGASRFFSEWGLAVLRSEAIWIGLPSILWIFIMRWKRRR